MSDKARLSAYNAVKRIFNGAYSNLISKDGLTGIDRAFAESIILGTLERKVTLEYVVSLFLKKETDKDVTALLLTGAYQILYMDRVPDNAACDETVKIAKELFGNKTSGFINAVLRNICRNKEALISKIENAEGHIKYSANKELFDLLKGFYPDSINEIFGSFFGSCPVYLRVNTLKTDAEAVKKLVGGKIVSKKTVEAENPKAAVENIDSGDYFIQGLASQKAVELLDAQPGDVVVDVCACPGGKSLGTAINMKNRGKIYSMDLHGNKLPLIEKSAEKLGISIITTAKQDAKGVKNDLLGMADRVICDVPCSGTGVIAAKPEIKYKSPGDFSGLYPTQRAIINSASRYLKIGGVMVYSTCSINKHENEAVVEDFINKNDGFKLIYERTCLPFEEEREGFYMAKIIRER